MQVLKPLRKALATAVFPELKQLEAALAQQVAANDAIGRINDGLLGSIAGLQARLEPLKFPLEAGKTCDHDWGDEAVGISSVCRKCNMTFYRHVHMECP